jgi:hypothetical protein
MKMGKSLFMSESKHERERRRGRRGGTRIGVEEKIDEEGAVNAVEWVVSGQSGKTPMTSRVAR